MKTKIIIAIVVLMIISGLIDLVNETKYFSEKKIELLKNELESEKITDEEKTILKINSENKKTKIEINKINEELNKLEKNKIWKKDYEECLKNQLIRIWEWKEVIDWYCENKNTEKVVKTTKIKAVSVPKVKKDIVIAKSNLEVIKSNLFMCKEVKNQFWLKSDEFRCASYMTMVKSFESNRWKSKYCNNYNNCYWLKNPTDKNWLKWNWSVGTWRFLKFETKEMWDYAFAYFYQKYHINKNASEFVNTYSDGNKNYIHFLINNYDNVYTEYKKL